MAVKITQRQAAQFRAMIKERDSGTLFDASENLATVEELASEQIDAAPISYTVYKCKNELAPYVQSTAQATPVPGYINVALPDTAFLKPQEVEQGNLDYNFEFVPENRKTFAFADVGQYFVDVTIYPKTGPAIVFRTSLEVA